MIWKIFTHQHPAFQFLRFATVGFFGILIDFGVLNLLSWATGITSGNGVIPINAIAFFSAILWSYIMNKRWTFADHSLGDNPRKFVLFLIVSLFSASLNTFIVAAISTRVEPFWAIHPQAWLNVAKLLATAASGITNFLGYKLLVFKK